MPQTFRTPGSTDPTQDRSRQEPTTTPDAADLSAQGLLSRQAASPDLPQRTRMLSDDPYAPPPMESRVARTLVEHPEDYSTRVSNEIRNGTLRAADLENYINPAAYRNFQAGAGTREDVIASLAQGFEADGLLADGREDQMQDRLRQTLINEVNNSSRGADRKQAMIASINRIFNPAVLPNDQPHADAQDANSPNRGMTVGQVAVLDLVQTWYDPAGTGSHDATISVAQREAAVTQLLSSLPPGRAQELRSQFIAQRDKIDTAAQTFLDAYTHTKPDGTPVPDSALMVETLNGMSPREIELMNLRLADSTGFQAPSRADVERIANAVPSVRREGETIDQLHARLSDSPIEVAMLSMDHEVVLNGDDLREVNGQKVADILLNSFRSAPGFNAAAREKLRDALTGLEGEKNVKLNEMDETDRISAAERHRLMRGFDASAVAAQIRSQVDVLQDTTLRGGRLNGQEITTGAIPGMIGMGLFDRTSGLRGHVPFLKQAAGGAAGATGSGLFALAAGSEDQRDYVPFDRGMRGLTQEQMRQVMSSYQHSQTQRIRDHLSDNCHSIPDPLTLVAPPAQQTIEQDAERALTYLTSDQVPDPNNPANQVANSQEITLRVMREVFNGRTPEQAQQLVAKIEELRRASAPTTQQVSQVPRMQADATHPLTPMVDAAGKPVMEEFQATPPDGPWVSRQRQNGGVPVTEVIPAGQPNAGQTRQIMDTVRRTVPDRSAPITLEQMLAGRFTAAPNANLTDRSSAAANLRDVRNVSGGYHPDRLALEVAMRLENARIDAWKSAHPNQPIPTDATQLGQLNDAQRDAVLQDVFRGLTADQVKNGLGAGTTGVSTSYTTIVSAEATDDREMRPDLLGTVYADSHPRFMNWMDSGSQRETTLRTPQVAQVEADEIWQVATRAGRTMAQHRQDVKQLFAQHPNGDQITDAVISLVYTDNHPVPRDTRRWRLMQLMRTGVANPDPTVQNGVDTATALRLNDPVNDPFELSHITAEVLNNRRLTDDQKRTQIRSMYHGLSDGQLRFAYAGLQALGGNGTFTQFQNLFPGAEHDIMRDASLTGYNVWNRLSGANGLEAQVGALAPPGTAAAAKTPAQLAAETRVQAILAEARNTGDAALAARRVDVLRRAYEQSTGRSLREGLNGSGITL